MHATAPTFTRRIKAATGYTPIEHVQTLRIEEISRFLETGTAPVKTIAFEVGYEDPTVPPPGQADDRRHPCALSPAPFSGRAGRSAALSRTGQEPGPRRHSGSGHLSCGSVRLVRQACASDPGTNNLLVQAEEVERRPGRKGEDVAQREPAEAAEIGAELGGGAVEVAGELRDRLLQRRHLVDIAVRGRPQRAGPGVAGVEGGERRGPSAVGRSGAIRRLDPEIILSGHLPLARRGAERLTRIVGDAYGRGTTATAPNALSLDILIVGLAPVPTH